MTTKIDNKGASSDAIQHHYDVGNDFFRYWLGETFTYSAALYEEGDSLDDAQLRKLDYHINEARASGTNRVLDIGCGWGTLLRRLLDEHNVNEVVGLTLSEAQAEWIRSELDRPEAKVFVEDWAKHVAAEPYDAIVSIGAFEHFAARGISVAEKISSYRAFFQRCHDWLQPGGSMSLQTIAYGNVTEAELSAFIENDIFPESDLPYLSEIASAAEGIFEIVRVRNDRQHYGKTLRAWIAGMQGHKWDLIDLYGREVFDRYLTYLKLFVIGFHTGRMDLYRVTLHRYDRQLP